MKAEDWVKHIFDKNCFGIFLDKKTPNGPKIRFFNF